MGGREESGPLSRAGGEAPGCWGQEGARVSPRFLVEEPKVGGKVVVGVFFAVEAPGKRQVGTVRLGGTVTTGSSRAVSVTSRPHPLPQAGLWAP